MMKPETRAYLATLSRDENFPLAARAVLSHLCAASFSAATLSAFAKHCAKFHIPGSPGEGTLGVTAKEGSPKEPVIN